MAFKKMQKPKYPPRQWSLVGYPGSGKSSFAAQMRGPKLVIDSDHRFTEVLGNTDDDVYQLSDNPSDNVDPDTIAKVLNQNMRGADVKTIIVDSLTAIITPLMTQAVIDNDKGRNRNQIAAFKTKALAMRQLQDAVTRWGTDCLWIYHLQDSRDAKAKEITRSSVSETELARLKRCLNMQLEIVQESSDPQSKRGIRIVWARKGRSGMVIWDESGCWENMPARVEAAVYDGLTKQEQDKIAASTPTLFKSPDAAYDWAIQQKVFENAEQAKEAYENVKVEGQPASASEMATLWVNYVQTHVKKSKKSKKKKAS